MVAFVGKYCMSLLFSTEEVFVRKRGHWSIAQSLRRWGKWLGGQPFLERNGAKAKKSMGISTLLGRQILGPSLSPWDFSQERMAWVFLLLTVLQHLSSTLSVYSSGKRGRDAICTVQSQRPIGRHKKYIEKARKPGKTERERCALDEGAGSPVELWRFSRRGLRGKFWRRHGSKLSLSQERWRGEVLLLQGLA